MRKIFIQKILTRKIFHIVRCFKRLFYGIWKKYNWNTKICQKYSNIPTSIHHAKDINIAVVVNIYNTHFFLSFFYIKKSRKLNIQSKYSFITTCDLWFTPSSFVVVTANQSIESHSRRYWVSFQSKDQCRKSHNDISLYFFYHNSDL